MIELVGEIKTGINAYYDRYQEEQKFLIGYRERKIKFVIGNTKELSFYIKALENYETKDN